MLTRFYPIKKRINPTTLPPILCTNLLLEGEWTYVYAVVVTVGSSLFLPR